MIDFEALYREQYPHIYAYLLFKTGSREDAADLAQDTFLRLWQHQGEMPNVTHKWLYTVAKRLFLDRALHQAVTLRHGNVGSWEALEMDASDAADFTEQLAERDEIERRVSQLWRTHRRTVAHLAAGEPCNKMAVCRMRKAYHAQEVAG